MAATYRRAAHWQSFEVGGTSLVVRRACDQVRPQSAAEPNRKWIGIDIELRSLGRRFEWLDPAGLQAVDAESDTVIDARPVVQRLTDDGIPAAIDDPALADAGTFRCLLVYPAPISCREIALRYEGRTLTTRPLQLTKCELRLPEPTERVVDWTQRSAPEAAALGEDRYLVLVECWQWPRCAEPTDVAVRVLSNVGTATQLTASGVLEVDDKLRPVKRPWTERPYHVPVRWFLLEFRCPTGSVVVDMVRGHEPLRVPTARPLDVPAATLSDLTARADAARH